MFSPDGFAARSGVGGFGVSVVIIFVHSSTVGLAYRMFLLRRLSVGVMVLSSVLVFPSISWIRDTLDVRF